MGVQLHRTGEHVLVKEGQQSGEQQPGVRAGSTPEHAARPQDHPGSEQCQDVHRDWLISGLDLLKNPPWSMLPPEAIMLHEFCVL